MCHILTDNSFSSYIIILENWYIKVLHILRSLTCASKETNEHKGLCQFTLNQTLHASLHCPNIENLQTSVVEELAPLFLRPFL